MMINITFSYIMAVSFIGGVNRMYPEKTTDLLQITDKLYHIKYKCTRRLSGIQLTTLVVIGTDCIGTQKI
jgi:hypothetical protein